MPIIHGEAQGHKVSIWTRGYKRNRHYNWMNNLIKVILILAVIFGFGLICYNGYNLFTSAEGSIAWTVIFLVECGIWIWLVVLLRKSKYKYIKPSFKVVFFSIVGIVLVCTFAGVEPFNIYKDAVLVSYNKQTTEIAVNLQKQEEIDRIGTEQGIFDLTNKARVMNGLPPLVRSKLMDNLALEHSKYMNEFNVCDHSGFEIRASKINATMVAENVAQGFFNSEGFVNGWLSSEGHRKNIMTPKFRYIGIGYFNRNATQLFSN